MELGLVVGKNTIMSESESEILEESSLGRNIRCR